MTPINDNPTRAMRVVRCDETMAAVLRGECFLVFDGAMGTMLQQAGLHRPAGQECVLTAHAAPGWMLDAADYLTEMCCRRHPYQKGIAARKGVEY